MLSFGGSSYRDTPPYDSFFRDYDDWREGYAVPLEEARRALAPEALSVMNEFIPTVEDWCAGGGPCP